MALPPLSQSAPKVIQLSCLSSWFVWSHNLWEHNSTALNARRRNCVDLVQSSTGHSAENSTYLCFILYFVDWWLLLLLNWAVLYSCQNSWPLELQWGKCPISAVANAEICLNGNEYCYSSFTNQSSKPVFHEPELMSTLWQTWMLVSKKISVNPSKNFCLRSRGAGPDSQHLHIDESQVILVVLSSFTPAEVWASQCL